MRRGFFVREITGLLLLGMSASASATLINFSEAGLGVADGSTHDFLDMTVDGLTVNISAYTIENDGNGNIFSLDLLSNGVHFEQGSGGSLGVKHPLFYDSGDMDGGRPSSGSDLDEGLLFIFDELVSLNYVDFDLFTIGKEESFNLTVDGVRILWDHNIFGRSPWADGVGSTFDEYTFNNVIGREFLIWADGKDDSFRIDQMIVSSVPEPATILLFGVGCLGVGFMGSKRRV